MTCINSVIGYREMNQMVSQRERYVGRQKIQSKYKLLSIALYSMGTREKWRGSLKNGSLFPDPSTAYKAVNLFRKNTALEGSGVEKITALFPPAKVTALRAHQNNISVCFTLSGSLPLWHFTASSHPTGLASSGTYVSIERRRI